MKKNAVDKLVFYFLGKRANISETTTAASGITTAGSIRNFFIYYPENNSDGFEKLPFSLTSAAAKVSITVNNLEETITTTANSGGLRLPSIPTMLAPASNANNQNSFFLFVM